MAEFDPAWQGEDVQEWVQDFDKDGQQQRVTLRRTVWRDWDEGEKTGGVSYELDATDFLANFVCESEFRATAAVMAQAMSACNEATLDG